MADESASARFPDPVHSEWHLERFADLARRVLASPARLGSVRLVAVDGPSGAGKTHFADRLAAAFEAPPPIVRLDDLLNGWEDQLTFWPRLTEWVLEPLRAGHSGRYQRYDWRAGAFDPQWHPVPVADVVILDGVSAARAVIRPGLTRSVFVTAPRDLRLRRALARDGADIAPYLHVWRAVERRHFADDATADHVDLLVDGAPTVPHDPAREYIRLDR